MNKSLNLLTFSYAFTSHRGKIEYATGTVKAVDYLDAMQKVATNYADGIMAMIPRKGGALSLEIKEAEHG